MSNFEDYYVEIILNEVALKVDEKEKKKSEFSAIDSYNPF